MGCEQTAPRAELVALEVATRFPGEVHTSSDCQCALDTVGRIRYDHFSQLSGKDCDVATTIREQLHSGLQFHKIKAHQDLDSISDVLQVYHALGNACADTIAKTLNLALMHSTNC